MLKQHRLTQCPQGADSYISYTSNYVTVQLEVKQISQNETGVLIKPGKLHEIWFPRKTE